MNGAGVLPKRAHTKRRVTTVARRNIAVRHARATKRVQHPRFAWYAGLAFMAAIEIIEWPLAVVMMVGHEISHRAHNRALRELAEGVEAGA